MLHDDDAPPNTSKLLEGLATPKKTSFMEREVGMFPPAFNKLRRVLYEEHHDMWEVVGGMMIHNHEYFISSMNAVLDTLVDGSMSMQDSCEHWLKALEHRPKCFRKG